MGLSISVTLQNNSLANKYAGEPIRMEPWVEYAIQDQH